MSSEPTAFFPDQRFFETAPAISVIDVVRLTGGELHHVPENEVAVSHVAPVSLGDVGSAVYVESARALPAETSPFAPALVLAPKSAVSALEARWPNAAIVLTDAPRAGFAAIAHALHRSRMGPGATPSDAPPQVSSSASVDPSARIMAGAEIAARAYIGPQSVVGPGTIIGEGTIVGANVTISHAMIGRECVLSAGVRIGEAGFGYAPGPHGAQPVPQLGRVLLGDHVDIGANSTVDRGALEDTVIGDGTKIDNLVQVAHNCRIGRHVLIAAQTGISGSCKIGDGVMIGGQVGMADHLDIGDKAVITAKAGLMKDIGAGERWGGFPAKPAREWIKEIATVAKLTKKGGV